MTHERRPRGIAWDEDFRVDGLGSGDIRYLSDDGTADPPVILVPDGRGDYREHRVIERPKGRLGF